MGKNEVVKKQLRWKNRKTQTSYQNIEQIKLIHKLKLKSKLIFATQPQICVICFHIQLVTIKYTQLCYFFKLINETANRESYK